ncbi:transcriptional regulator [Peribacillus frigoritolerans]|uniref:transcriptional regulator n=1 Tax=Peribacillus frigoritolerans TaxID=450367 RepID=UPI001F4F17A4|nr:transcriptional regulator [Peribacillus frigoritolerans]MCK2020770.1 transcriptional regulator [Peribacillus frigoritolerans]
MHELRKYESFKSVSEMDKYVSKVLEVLELTELDRSLLRLLAGHSCKFVGVSFLKVQTMAQKLGVSYKTAQRSLKRLKELEVIKRVRTLRVVSGGFGASITIISPYALTQRKQAEKPTPEPSQEPSNQKETFLFKAFLKDLKNLRQPEPTIDNKIDYTYLTEWVPEEFIQVVKPFVNAEEAFSLWGKVHMSSKKYAPSVQDILEPAIRAFKASVLAYKSKRIKKSFGAYFWGTLSGVFSVEQRKSIGSNICYWIGNIDQ